MGSYWVVIIGASALPNPNRFSPFATAVTPSEQLRFGVAHSAFRFPPAGRTTPYGRVPVLAPSDMVFVRDGIREGFGRRQTVAEVHATGVALDEAAVHQHRDRALRSTGLLARRNCIEGGESRFRESLRRGEQLDLS